MSKVYIERAGMLTKEGIRAVCGTEEEEKKKRWRQQYKLFREKWAGEEK